MGHPEAGELLALHDGELDAARRAQVAEHLERCEGCREELDSLLEASRRFTAALAVVDAAAPVPALPAGLGARRPRRRVWAPLARAALLLLVLAGAASAVIPGSLVREWVVALARPDAEEPSLPSADPVVVPAPPPEAPPPASVSALPREGVIHISVTGFEPESSIRVRLVEGAEARVQVSGGAEPRFRIGPGRIEVMGSGGHVHVELPRGAREATVEVDGRPAVLKRGDELQLLRPALDSLQGDVRFHVGP